MLPFMNSWRGRQNSYPFTRLFVAFIVSCSLGIPVVSAQFLRLGPFDFAADSGVEAVYTTNVEGEKESEATADREDFYFVWSLDLNAVAEVNPNTELSISTGIAIEEHLNRSDLNNSENPFGRFSVLSVTDLRALRLEAQYSYERNSESADDEIVFDPVSRKKRDVRDDTEYAVRALWDWRALSAYTEYNVTSERHEDEDFQDADQDETTVSYGFYWQALRNLGFAYDVERTKTEVVNLDEEAEWLTTETLAIDWLLTIIQRPSLTYSLALEKEDTDEEDGEWEPVHTLSASDEWSLTERLNAGFSAEYSYEETEEQEDISFTYAAKVEHILSAYASHTLSAEREPVETLGSSVDTDNTTIDYNLNFSDVFIFGLDAGFGVSYELNEPLDKSSPKEKRWTYLVTVNHTRQLTRRLSRSLEYTYDYEKSDLEDEHLDEHRITLSYLYKF